MHSALICHIGKFSRLFLSLFLAVSCLLSFSILPAHAQQYNSQNSAPVDPTVPSNESTRMQIAFIELLATIHCQLTGIDPVNPQQPCLGIDLQSHKIAYAPQNNNQASGGALGMMGGMIGSLYVPPVQTGDYINYLGSNFGITHTYAQFTGDVQNRVKTNGFGFEAARPLMKVFTLTRNVAYLFLVLAFIVIGMAIMLRIKIDPRTVMSVQNQIPKIIISILLITFSYAIVGVLIDTMWTLSYVAINTLSSVNPPTGEAIINVDAATRGITYDPIVYSGRIFGSGSQIGEGAKGHISIIANVAWSASNIVTDIIAGVFHLDPKEANCGAFGLFGSGSVGGCIEKGIFYVFAFIISIIVGLIVAIAYFIVLFRIWFMLIKAFAMIVLDTVAAPLWIVGGLFPGSKLSFSQWFRHLSSNIMVFPATITMFLLAKILLDSFNSIGTSDPKELPVLLPPLIGNVNDAGHFGVLLAFGVVLLIPDMLEMLKNALKTPPSQYGGRARSRFMGGNPLGALPGLSAWGYNMQYAKNAPFVGGVIGWAGKLRHGGDDTAKTPGIQPPPRP